LLGRAKKTLKGPGPSPKKCIEREEGQLKAYVLIFLQVKEDFFRKNGETF